MSSHVQNLKEDFDLKYDTKDIGKRVKELRETRKMSVNFLAHKACIDHSMLMRAERGEREPMLSTLLKIIDGLGLQPAEFFKVFD
jgi:transcriptional regulator with XRE-family HTH domain